jgi:hypothetical protein
MLNYGTIMIRRRKNGEHARHVQDFGSRASAGPGQKAAPLFEAYLTTRLPPAKP